MFPLCACDSYFFFTFFPLRSAFSFFSLSLFLMHTCCSTTLNNKEVRTLSVSTINSFGVTSKLQVRSGFSSCHYFLSLPVTSTWRQTNVTLLSNSLSLSCFPEILATCCVNYTATQIGPKRFTLSLQTKIYILVRTMYVIICRRTNI